MARLRGPQRFRARVLAPGWASPGRLAGLALLAVGLGGGVLANGMGQLSLAWVSWGGVLGLGLLGLFPGRRRWAEAEVQVEEGAVQIRREGGRTERLLARRIQALSTAQSPAGPVVAVRPWSLGFAPRSPVLIEVEQAAQAEALCDALAVGNRGHGALEWYPQPRHEASTQRRIAWLMVIGALAGLLFWSLGVWPQPMPEMSLAGALGLHALLLLSRSRRKIRLDQHGVDLSGLAIGWGRVPYGGIEDALVEGRELVLRLTPPHGVIRVAEDRFDGLSGEELEHLAEQLRCAAQRTRGLGPTVQDREATLEGLKRGGESIPGWLQRLDAQAAALRSGAYRSDGLNASELWDTLDDHDAPAEIRVAAARVLLRVEPEQARLRVASLAQAQREASAREALAVAAEAEDLEELAHRLERCGLWAPAATREDPGAS